VNALSELKTMIAAAIARNPAGRARLAELKAIQWRLVDAVGNYVQPCGGMADLMNPPRFGPLDTAAVFDGRDNEDQKLRYFTATTGRVLSVEILPQIVCAS
jgi:hypothetical protein